MHTLFLEAGQAAPQGDFTIYFLVAIFVIFLLFYD
jgi:hypothetical protein